MRRLLASLVLIGASTIGALGQATTHACSFPVSFDAWGTSDVIIGGRIIDSEPLPDDTPGFRVTMEIDRTFKGAAPGETFEFVDYLTSCGVLLGEESIGQYAILGFDNEEDPPVAFLGRSFFLGDEPAGEMFENAVDQLSPVPTNGPAVRGANGIVIEGGGTPAMIASKFADQTDRPVRALWAAIDGEWQFFLPSQPEIDGGLFFFPTERAVAAIAVLG